MRKNNHFGFCFYAGKPDQFSTELMSYFGRVEADLFSYSDLKDDNWCVAWRNIETVAKIVGESNLSFHFPMNSCDYINNPFVMQRLLEAIDNCNRLGIRTMVLHPNLIYKLSEWRYIDRSKMRTQLYDRLFPIIQMSQYTTIGIENMPPIGNLCDDADSALMFMEDFSEPFRYTFDVCHYFNVVSTMKEAEKKPTLKDFLVAFKPCDYFDFVDNLSLIKHYHFSAFDRIARPDIPQRCFEGKLPTASELPEELFAEAMKIIYKDSIENDKSIIFEIHESDYTKRTEVLKMLNWAEKVLSGIDG